MLRAKKSVPRRREVTRLLQGSVHEAALLGDVDVHLRGDVARLVLVVGVAHRDGLRNYFRSVPGSPAGAVNLGKLYLCFNNYYHI